MTQLAEEPRRGDGLDRRTFVKGCLGAAVAGAGAATWYAAGKPLSPHGLLHGGPVRYAAARLVSGPAKRGLPLLPVAVTAEGVIEGRESLEGEGVLTWYKYCGHEAAPGLQEGYRGGDALRYHITEDRLAQMEAGERPWYADRAGEVVRAAHFTEELQGAAVAWRSEGEDARDVITAVVIRVDPERVAYEGLHPGLARAAGLAEGFLAFVTFCTHFCCVATWREAERITRTTGHWNDVYCTCHGAAWDPFTLTWDEFVYVPPGARPP